MKARVGVGIALVTTLLALLVDPATLLGVESIQIKLAYAAVLLGLAGLAFMLGYQTAEIDISRQIAIWSSTLAAIAILATNMDIITGSSKVFKPVAKVKKTYKPRKPRYKKPESTAIYVPDTPKLERIERIVTPESNGFNPLADQEDRLVVPNLYSKKNTRLAQDWKISDEQKEQFKKFLESQGLKYDPDTAFNPPGVRLTPPPRFDTDPQAAKGDATGGLN